MQKNKFLSLLGLARKAGKTAFGYDKALDSVHRGKAFAVFTSEDLSEKTFRGLKYASEEYDFKLIKLPCTMFEISEAIGQKTGVVSIMDRGFAHNLVKLAEN